MILLPPELVFLFVCLYKSCYIRPMCDGWFDLVYRAIWKYGVLTNGSMLGLYPAAY